jgi:hypothetical protein
MGESTGQPADNGRATQCKIHYSLIATDDGLLYAATHLSGPPLGHLIYNPWGNWGDPHVSFAGANLVVYDTSMDSILWTGCLYPQEGCRCLALDPGRRRLYSCSYPLNHFHLYDLDTRRDTDYGRIGAVNPQAIWLDPDFNAYTTDDRGRILRFDADARRLEMLDCAVPHPAYQNGWHDIVYDVTPCSEAGQVMGVAWNACPHLWRYDMTDGPQGRMDDLGPIHAGLTGHEPNRINESHVGGLAFGPDGCLYYSVMCGRGPGGRVISHLKRYHTDTGEHEDLGPLYDSELDQHVWYISRATWVSNQDLILATVGRTPTGIAHVHFGEGEIPDSGGLAFRPARLWG